MASVIQTEAILGYKAIYLCLSCFSIEAYSASKGTTSATACLAEMMMSPLSMSINL